MENSELSDSQTLCNQPTDSVEALSLELSTYQVAVLSTLFDQNDDRKLIALAEQWGCEQERLQVVWQTMHRNLIGTCLKHSG
jgi:hypothetical protein